MSRHDEQAAERTRRLYAAQSATNEAILKAADPDDLYARVCDAVILITGFRGAGVLLPVEGGAALRYVCGVDRDGPLGDLSKFPALPCGPGNEEVRGFVAEAFDTGRAVYSNDYANDPRLCSLKAMGNPANVMLRQMALARGINSGACVPIMREGHPAGVIAFFLEDKDAIEAQMLELMHRIAENVAFALGNFEKALMKRKAEKASERLRQVYAALSVTNEALLKSRDEDEMFRCVCQAVADTGDSFGAAVFTLPEGDDEMTLRAYAGGHEELVRDVRFSLRDGDPRSGGLHGPALAGGGVQWTYDVTADPRTASWAEPFRGSSAHRSWAAAPLTRGGAPFGVMIFFGDLRPFGSLGGETQLLDLMRRIAENVSFKLDALAAERRTAKLKKMFASLSEINEAIIQAATPERMLDAVCRTASEGDAPLGAAVLMHDPDGKTLVQDASAGKFERLLRTLTLHIDQDTEIGQGTIAKAFRNGEAVFVSDLAGDSRYIPFRTRALRHGVKAFAALPLTRGGETVGLLLFLLGDGPTIESDTEHLMRRIADNISFALDNFAREAAQERLARMFAALSATNEAIMHATSRDELFRQAAEAVARSGDFASVTIAVKDPAGATVRVAAVAGPAREEMARLQYSVEGEDPRGRGLVGAAMRQGAVVHSNDLAEPEHAAFREAFGRTGQRSGACVPLKCRGDTVGALLMMSTARGGFVAEYLELIARFGDNISFALDNLAAAEEREAAAKRIQYLATHDEMTSLPNRAAFSHMLNASIRSSARHSRRLAVLFIDLDRFKVINDTLGHEAGDALLVETGRRISSCLRADDIVARLGGDEFVVILNEIRGHEGVAAVAGSLLEAVGRPVELSGHECRVSASIGVAIYPDHGADEQTLMKRADMAMYQAKEDGKNDFRFFSEDGKTQSVERLMMEAALRHALERDEFRVHYQPKIDIASGAISGVEALVRWEHPDLGMVSPGQFIPLAEETGLIVPIGRWVLRQACRQNMAWKATGVGPVKMAVNLSPRQFSHESLLKDIDEALADSGMPPALLQLEVTESMVMQNVERAIAMLDAIKKRGVSLAIDDFGTGYSSMSLIKRFPIDTLKVDRSFIKDLPEDQEDMAITQAIISMAKALKLNVVAEGVETDEQKAFLDRQGCDEMQGFLFSMPLPAEQFAELALAQAVSPPLQSAGEAFDAAARAGA